mmetsp:Transcript_19541/g.48760  ORF Transcript_19541/g.48760 Transcript_19541/m.48760 type:complete len:299 (-) Transcript_19541:192-1088(-)
MRLLQSVVFVLLTCQFSAFLSSKPVLSIDDSGNLFFNLSFFIEPDPPRPSHPIPLLVAHCITGQHRTLAMRSVFTGYKKNAVDALEAESRLFYVLSVAETHVPERYQTVWETMRPEKVLWIAEGAIPESNLGPLCLVLWRCKQFLRMAVCFELVRRDERKNSRLFSHVLLTRPDAFFPRSIGPAKLWRTDMVMTPFYEFAVRGKELGLENVSIAEPIYLSWPENRSHSGVCDILNIVPRSVAHELFVNVVELQMPRDRWLWNGDGTWRTILDRANLTLSHHGIDLYVMALCACLKDLE